MTRRYVVIGAGAVGAALAAGLVDAGIPVVLVSRGRTYAAIAENGLRFTHEGRTRVLDVPVVEGAPGVELQPGDVLLLTVKSQDAASALSEWSRRPVAGRALAGEVLPVVTLQNGLEAERVALRHFAVVVSGTTLVAAQHVDAGEVTVRSGPEIGRIVLGAHPSAHLAPEAAALVPQIAADLRAAQWLIHEADDPRRWKAWKTATAATFAVEVFAGTPEEQARLQAEAREEARVVLAAAGYDFADPSELGDDPAEARPPRPAPSGPFGLSTWQSFARGSGSEVDFLSGEIVLQARMVGIPAPVNAAIQRALAEAEAAGERPGVRPLPQLLAANTGGS